MSRYTMPLAFLSGSTRSDLAPQTWTEPPPAWTLAAWQFCWECSPGNRRTFMPLSTRCSWKHDSSLHMMWDQAASVNFCPVLVEPVMIGCQKALPQDHLAMLYFGHKSVVILLRANTHYIQISHLLSEGTGTFKVVFMEIVRAWRWTVGRGPVLYIGD